MKSMKHALAVLLLIATLTMCFSTALAVDTRVVVGGWLRLRSAPSYQAETIASYPSGTVVTVLSSVSGWCYVSLPDGKTGYMASGYLSSTGGSGGTTGGGGGGGSGSSGYGTTATVVSYNGLGVRLRSGPSTAYGILRVCPVGTVVTVLNSGANWSYVRVGGINGYMMSQFLSTGGSIAPSTGYLAMVISANGLGVRLRNGPGYGYAVLGVYSVGTQVTVLNHGSQWDYIRIGTRTGYMMNAYLTTQQVITQISAVSLNNYQPAVGDVLTASVTPSAATVIYSWVDAYDNVIGNGPNYVVSASDVGMRIRLRVTGTGMYSGSAISKLTNSVTTSGSPSVGKLPGVTINNMSPVVGTKLIASVSPAGADANYWWFRSDGTLISTGDSYIVTSADIGYGIAVTAVGTGHFGGEVYSAYTNAVPSGSSPVSTPVPTSNPDDEYLSSNTDL